MKYLLQIYPDSARDEFERLPAQDQQAIVDEYLLDHRYRKRVPPDWLPAHAYHRPLGAYVNELARCGFALERVVEEHHPDADTSGVPGILYARAVAR